ncbi:MAG: MFS transporter [Chloroflexi bacterium HGW-Chloroflexi-6]|nr:MAG: MFS transporter [Chloroflexi bacterium HGW-Chloroflexi-6]
MTNQAPTSPFDIERQNYRNVQLDAIGVGLASAAAPFLPVFLARLGASNFQVGLLSSMPGVTGLILAIIVGRFLQTRRNIVPWFSLSRLLVLSSYAFTGLIAIFVAQALAVKSILAVWALATLPQTALAVAFSVVMNAVAGPDGRYNLLSRRWAIIGLTNTVVTFLATQMLDRVVFPLNYQLLFIALSVGGLISFYFSSRITLPDQSPPPLVKTGQPLGAILRDYRELLRTNPAFVSFVSKRFVYLSAIALGAPIFPLYYVRQAAATDAQIGTINMTLTLMLMVGYFTWARVSPKRGARFVLLVTTLGLTLYPALTSTSVDIRLMIAFAGLAGFFQAGIDLVFFDELMKTVPPEYSATLVSIAQSLQYLSAILAPLIGTFLADTIGLSGALLVSAGLRLIGFLLFLRPDRRANGG